MVKIELILSMIDGCSSQSLILPSSAEAQKNVPHNFSIGPLILAFSVIIMSFCAQKPLLSMLLPFCLLSESAFTSAARS